MNKFNKIVAIEPVSLIPEYEEKLKTLADEVVMYGDIPTDDDMKRIAWIHYIFFWPEVGFDEIRSIFQNPLLNPKDNCHADNEQSYLDKVSKEKGWILNYVTSTC